MSSTGITEPGSEARQIRQTIFRLAAGNTADAIATKVRSVFCTRRPSGIAIRATDRCRSLYIDYLNTPGEVWSVDGLGLSRTEGGGTTVRVVVVVD